MNPKVKNAIEWGYCFIIAVILAITVRYFVGTPTVVKQVSMQPTFVENERLILNRLAVTFNHEWKRGEIITFEAPSTTMVSLEDADLSNPVAKYENSPDSLFGKFTYYVLEWNKMSYIKRIIGLPGEHVQIRDGKVYINGEELQESYLHGVETGDMNGVFIDIIVPENCVFVMGDNRPHSTDSRCFGCVPMEKIEGKVVFRFWPLNRFGSVD